MRDFGGDNRSGGWQGGKKFGGKRDFGGRDERPAMHQATCSECGITCEVPFKPNGMKPVFCRDCFKNVNSDAPERSERRDFDRPSYDKPSYDKPSYDRPSYDKPAYEKPAFKPAAAPAHDHKDQFEMLNVKLDYVLKALSQMGATKTCACSHEAKAPAKAEAPVVIKAAPVKAEVEAPVVAEKATKAKKVAKKAKKA